MTEDVAFDLAVAGDRVFRIEPAPGASVHVAPELPLDGPIVGLPDGRTARRVRRSLLESVFHISTWTAEGAQLAGVDPLVGVVAEDDRPLVQVRLAPPLPEPWFPALLTGASRPDPDPEPVRAAAMAAIAAHAPRGLREVRLECRTTARRMEITATVHGGDGIARSWSPPAIVGQWLHRLRVRHHRSRHPKWFTARFVLRPGEQAEAEYVVDEPPRWLVDPGHGAACQHLADDWRLLPVLPRQDLLPEWQLSAGLDVLRRQSAAAITGAEQPEQAACEVARLFDGRDGDGRPVWHRPTVDAREAVGVLRYLENAPVALPAGGFTEDEFTGEPTVPTGFRTDGRWVWSSAVAFYLDKHGVPPVTALVDHIRNRRYRLPDEVPRIALGRAAALAAGRLWDESGVDAEFAAAVAPVAQRFPGRCSLGEHRDGTWCVVRDGDWYRVYLADGGRAEHAQRFGDVSAAAAYLAGRLLLAPPSPPAPPPVADAPRAEALRGPGGWVWCVDPDADPRLLGGTPSYVCPGAHQVGPSGEPTGAARPNPDYRPGPSARGFPEPRTEFERVMAYVAADWLPRERLQHAALNARFLVESDGAGTPATGRTSDGRRSLAVFTSPGHLPPTARAPIEVTGRALLPLLAGAVLLVNPGGFGLELSGDHVVAAAC